jgi:hypothetical protein
MPRCTTTDLLYDLLVGSMKTILIAMAVIAGIGGACCLEILDAKLDRTAPNHMSAMVQ